LIKILSSFVKAI